MGREFLGLGGGGFNWQIDCKPGSWSGDLAASAITGSGDNGWNLRQGYTWIGVKFEVIFKKKIVSIKMGWKHYQTVPPPPPQKKKREPQVGRGLFGVHLLILHFKFKFFKFIKTSTSHIFLNLTYPLRKNISFLVICPKITQKLHKTAKQWLNEISREI